VSLRRATRRPTWRGRGGLDDTVTTAAGVAEDADAAADEGAGAGANAGADAEEEAEEGAGSGDVEAASAIGVTASTSCGERTTPFASICGERTTPFAWWGWRRGGSFNMSTSASTSASPSVPLPPAVVTALLWTAAVDEVGNVEAVIGGGGVCGSDGASAMDIACAVVACRPPRGHDPGRVPDETLVRLSSSLRSMLSSSTSSSQVKSLLELTRRRRAPCW